MTSVLREARPQILAASIGFFLCVLPIAAMAKPFLEDNVSRWGADYRRFNIASGGAEDCAEACAKDDRCRAWSYVKPGVSGPKALCRLKSAVPQAMADPCCVSGIAAGASAGVVAGYVSPDKTTSMAEAEPKHAAPKGVTAAIKRPAAKLKASSKATAAKKADEVLQMPIEAETPEALGAISAPINLSPNSWIETND
jgi:PAN domain